jgi:hypothetical protein
MPDTVQTSAAERRARELEEIISRESSKGSGDHSRQAQDRQLLQRSIAEYLTINPSLRTMMIVPSKDVMDHYSRLMSPLSQDADAVKLAQRYRDEFHFKYPQYAPPAVPNRLHLTMGRAAQHDRVRTLRNEARSCAYRAIEANREADEIVAREGLEDVT